MVPPIGVALAILLTWLSASAVAQNAPRDSSSATNYADELTDFGAAPQDSLQIDLAAPTPLTIPGAKVVTTDQVRQSAGSTLVLIDVWRTGAHLSIPGALALPGAGDAGTFQDTLQQRLAMALALATRQNKARRLVFFCTEARCWEAYNAALRAVHLGYTNVEWYRGGLASWHAAGQPLAPIGTNAAPAATMP